MPDRYPADASRQLEYDQLFIDDLSKQLVTELHAACQLNPNLGGCSQLAHLWATSDSAPRSEAVGTPQVAGVM